MFDIIKDIPRSKLRIAIVCPLSSLDVRYSVAGVVNDQIRFFNDSTFHDVWLITTDDWNSSELKNVITLPRWNSIKEDLVVESFEFAENNIKTSYDKIKDMNFDVFIFHDVFFIKEFLPWNILWKRLLELLNFPRSLMWCHSGPSKPDWENFEIQARLSLTPNSTLVCLNRSSISEFAKMYQLPEYRVQMVRNPYDPTKSWDDTTISIYKKLELWKQDLIITFASRVSPAKQVHKIARLAAEFNNQGIKTKFIFCGSYANNPDSKEYTRIIKQSGIDKKGNQSTFCTNEDLGPEYELGVSQTTVLNLLRYSDMFIMPSLSEASSLILNEAIASKCLIVLNQDFVPFFEVGGQIQNDDMSELACYASFGSVTRPIESYLPDEDTWYKENAARLLKCLEKEKGLALHRNHRRAYDPHTIFHEQLEGLLY